MHATTFSRPPFASSCTIPSVDIIIQKRVSISTVSTETVEMLSFTFSKYSFWFCREDLAAQD